MVNCKYCGMAMDGKFLVAHIHKFHEAQYRQDLASGAVVQPVPRCPSCGSTNIARFSRAWKVTKIASVGVFGLGNVHKIFQCHNCGYKW
jgi:predicted RNA-binding Zn-ribbon protein involved in translation (DUF1610 family)